MYPQGSNSPRTNATTRDSAMEGRQEEPLSTHYADQDALSAALG